MNLSELRKAVRDQLDLPEEDDLSTALLDLYLAEGFNNVINREARWPFLEQSWEVQSTADGAPVTLPSDLASIDGVRRGSVTLEHVSHTDAEAEFEGVSGSPELYSTWGGQLFLWPQPTTVDTYVIRGWRQATDAWTLNAGNEPDTGSERRLDRCLVHYACYRAYQQQEDPELAEVYRVSFERALVEAHRAIMRPMVHGRIVMGRGRPRWARRRWASWVLD